MTNTNRDHNAWINALELAQDSTSETRQQLVNDYGGRALNSLEVNADERYVIVSFKDSPEITTIFKYPDDQLTIMEIEGELHKVMHELTEENEESILSAVFTLWLMNDRLAYFAQFTDALVDASETVHTDLDDEGNIMLDSYRDEGWTQHDKNKPVDEVAHKSGTGFG